MSKSAKPVALRACRGWLLSLCLLALGCGVEPDDAKLLSSQGLYRDIATRTPVSGAFEYEPDYPLWSDGVQKRRWMILPAGERIDTSEMDHWMFPVGAKLFKEFSVRGKLLETRLVERVASTGKQKRDYRLLTFVWRADQSDAERNDNGVKNVLGSAHDVPRQKDCIECHRGEPGAVLGVSAVQLSRSGLLGELAARSLLSVDPAREFTIPGDAIAAAAIGVMHANCGHCHSAEGGAPGTMHLRFLASEADQPLEQSEAYLSTLDQETTEWEEHPADIERRVVAGDPEHSAVFYRMQQRGGDEQMPPLATERVYPEGLAAVKAWIATLPHPSAGPRIEPRGPNVPPPSAADAAMPRAGPAAADSAAGAAGAPRPVAGAAGAAGDSQGGAAGMAAVDAVMPSAGRAAGDGASGAAGGPPPVAGAAATAAGAGADSQGGAGGIAVDSGGAAGGGASGDAAPPDIDAGALDAGH